MRAEPLPSVSPRVGDKKVGYSHAVAGTVVFFFLDDLAAGGGFAGAIILSVTLDTPIEDIVILITFANEQIAEELAEIGIIRLVIEAQSPCVIQENAKFVGESTAEEIGGGSHFLFHDTVILLLLGSSLQTLPREGASEEVHQDVGKRLEIIPASLFHTEMGVNRCVAGSSGEVLVLSVRNMEVCFRIPELLCKTEIYNVDLIATFSDAHQEVVGFDVAVDEVAGVDVFDSGDLGEC